MTKKTIEQLKENFYVIFDNYLKTESQKGEKNSCLSLRTLSNQLLDETERYIGGRFDGLRVFSNREIDVLNYAHAVLFKLHSGDLTPKSLYNNLKEFADNTKGFYEAVSTMNYGEYYRLLNAEKNVNTSLCESTPLIAAVKNGHLTMVMEIIKSGADVNQPDKDGFTPLYFALSTNGPSVGSTQALIIQFLVQAGAKTKNLDGNGIDATSLAVMNNHPKSLMFLLQKSFSTEGKIKEEDGKSVSFLNYAIRHSLFKVFQVLIANGADIHKKDETGKSPLMTADLLQKEVYKELMLERQESCSTIELVNAKEKKKGKEEKPAVISSLKKGNKKAKLIDQAPLFGGRHACSYPLYFKDGIQRSRD